MGKQNVVTMVNAASKVTFPRWRTPEVAPSPGWSRVALPRRAALSWRLSEQGLSADDYVGDVADRTGFGGLEATRTHHHALRPGSDERLPAGRDRPDQVQAVQTAMIAHCGLMGDRVDRRSAAGDERPADQGVAGRQGAPRPDVCDPLLAGSRP